MSSVAVFVFLLDNLAGFNNALNDTLTENAKYMHSDVSPILEKCDTLTTDQILSAVSQDLDLLIVPSESFRQEDNRLTNDQSKEPSTEIFNTVFDDSKQEAENTKDVSADKSYNVLDNEFNTFYRREIDNTEQETPRKEFNEVNNETKIGFPTSAPFLVAIFETLANVTAQTCAGTLLTPRWVLTASNCINILSNLYVNSTNMTEVSHYTIVAGSSNPLQDGSAHNVTAVFMHPDFNSSRKGREMESPYLALMRIEPEVEGPAMELMAEEVNSGDIMVYGWILSKNESDHDMLNRTSTAGQILSAAECQAMYSYRDNDVLCLFSSDMDKNVTQLSSGGPVLMVHDNKVKMLAVVQTDDHVFVSYPLAAHYDWISRTIRNT